MWLLILACAFLNGGFRQYVLIPWIGEFSGHIISALLLSLAVVAIAGMCASFLNVVSAWETWCIGGLWLLMTVAFEFLAGHFAFRVSWEKLLADYNISTGRIWILVLATTLVAPRWIYHRR